MKNVPCLKIDRIKKNYLVINAESLGVTLNTVPLEVVGALLRREGWETCEDVTVDVVEDAVAAGLREHN